MSDKSHVGTHFPTKCHIPWEYCRCCGLMNLKNEVSRKAWRQPCPAKTEDPS